LLGYAATCKVRSSDPPMSGESYQDRTDWWSALDQIPAPRISVIQDLEPAAGGSVVGEVHAAILKAFRCAGVITNGAVRDLPGVVAMDFPLFAGSVAVSHSYTHLVEYGQPVEVFGLKIRSGDLLYTDCHGAISIPLEIAERIPEMAARLREKEQHIIEVCQSPGFSPEKLLEALK
jgi:4-hydroxy-4-methyl-2-oxoglutarate aldolase